MATLASADGTMIGYDVIGSGPALVLVDGAMCFRSAGPLAALAAALQDRFTVFTYDRRGRGESGDTLPYSVDREVEDLRALVAVAGGSAYAFGMSSGAALVLRTAAVEPGLSKVALYEPPFLGELEHDLPVADYSERLCALLAEDRRGDAVALFMTQVGIPAPVIDQMRGQPFFAALERIAPTLAYDDQVLGDGRLPREVADRVVVPALVLSGDASPAGLQQAAVAATALLPAAEHAALAGQTHDLQADATAPVLAEFLAR